MSMITRCPACGTLFKVVPDQLKISEGWVRCGHCADVFDATAQLQGDEPEQAPPPHQVHESTVEPEPQRAVADSAETASELEAFPSSLDTEIGESVAFEAPDTAELEAEAKALVQDPRDEPFEFEFRRRDDTELEVSEPQREERTWLADVRGDFDAVSSFAGGTEDALHEDLSFVRAARRKAFWTRPAMRAALALVAFALGLLLALQVALHERDYLAAAQPPLRPWLTGLCRALDCTIAPPKQIDSIAIDGSSFNKLRGDAYRLSVTLRNQAGIELAMPALELTLTDVQDRPVARRVLMPAEVAPGAPAIAAASDWSGSLGLAVGSGAAGRIAGYRLLAFYP